MNLRLLLSTLALVALAATLGCSSDDGPVDPLQTADDQNASVVRGEVGDGSVEFEFLSEGGDDPAPRPGRFVISGSNVHYDTELGALVFDLTVTNASERSFPMPVTLTFVSLVPDSATVLNADNDETGPGAAFYCEFENDDLEWTPGEQSLPFTVQIGVAEGVSVGFVCRVDVGMVPGGGTIGGVVWHDLNEDGVIDPDEMGLEDVLIRLDSADMEPRRARSVADGTYRFDGLAPGYYTVTRVPADDLRPTTPLQMQIVLVTDENGDVTDFIGANFGCLVVEAPPEGSIEVGDRIKLKGEYDMESGRLMATEFECYEDDNESDCWSKAYGPVTGVDLENRTVSVMGGTYWITEDTDLDVDLEELEVGDQLRLKIEVIRTEDGVRLLACQVKDRNGEHHHDEVRGIVLRTDGATVVQVSGVPADLAEGLECEDDDDGDDDD